ncbi:HIT-like protein [Panus rudis PR-1116 ss-1]|nr:HIT-like protein [Panus rudis PR-1116 ss-1]
MSWCPSCHKPTSSDHKLDCVFCQIAQNVGTDTLVVFEDAEFVAFQDINPAALHHFLVIPKSHVDSVKSLTKADVPMVEKMALIGHTVLDRMKIPTDARRMGFHIPPFNSIDHLHLHVQSLPYKSSFRGLKYHVSVGTGDHVKGFSWFSEMTQTITILSRGRRVQVLPC